MSARHTTGNHGDELYPKVTEFLQHINSKQSGASQWLHPCQSARDAWTPNKALKKAKICIKPYSRHNKPWCHRECDYEYHEGARLASVSTCCRQAAPRIPFMSLDFASELQAFEITSTLHATQKLQQRMRAGHHFLSLSKLKLAQLLSLTV